MPSFWLRANSSWLEGDYSNNRWVDFSQTQWEEVEEAREASLNFGVDLEKGTDLGGFLRGCRASAPVWTFHFEKVVKP